VSDLEAARKIASNASVRVEPTWDGYYDAICEAVFGARRVEIKRARGLSSDGARLALIALLA
jgi:hypothetical protein